ncbi:MAG TPA: hypothetical protein PK154_07760 [Methanoregulaceae archaeon]|nr:hypothetical protein [Methanoregulaceae archaeon]HPW10992.1 hypothetical protein [Methanoregulaceae archaeon]
MTFITDPSPYNREGSGFAVHNLADPARTDLRETPLQGMDVSCSGKNGYVMKSLEARMTPSGREGKIIFHYTDFLLEKDRDKTENGVSKIFWRTSPIILVSPDYGSQCILLSSPIEDTQ